MGLPAYLDKDLQRFKNRYLDIIGFSSETGVRLIASFRLRKSLMSTETEYH